jgi:hypothetical protein
VWKLPAATLAAPVARAGPVKRPRTLIIVATTMMRSRVERSAIEAKNTSPHPGSVQYVFTTGDFQGASPSDP